ncbi:MAG: hypothetical protein CSA49_02945 [Gammaproteobacteria bacterium]|nr:MAG: hypothetical protein CSA49_02945 [Gammaproteobacteria bacterium]
MYDGGIELYTDSNGNRVYDRGERFSDLNKNGYYDGAEGFVDANGNGLYDHGEAYTDANDNGQYDPGEFFTDINGNGEYDSPEEFVDANGNGFYDVGEDYVDSNANGRYDAPEAFADLNGNGLYDADEGILHLDEAYNDENGNGQYDYGEYYSDFDGSGDYSLKLDRFYRGSNCTSDAFAAGHCRGVAEIRGNMYLCMSSDAVLIKDSRNGSFDMSTDGNTVDVTISDINGLLPAFGTTVDIVAEGIEIIGGGSFKIPNGCADPKIFGKGITQTIVVGPDSNAATTGGTLTINVTSVDGAVYSRVILVSE